ncbi:MAG: P-loop NTPase [Acidobacteriota bacterium]
MEYGRSEQAEEQSKEELRLKDRLSRITHKLIVMSGKGGVGKSSVSVYIALGLARLGRKVGLLDVDLHGPSIPRMVGASGMFKVDLQNRLIPKVCDAGLKVVSMECLLENPDSAIIWRGPVKHGVIRQFISEVNWGDLDFLVVDCPPGTGDEPMSVAQSIPDAKAVIVTTPQEVALADVRKSIDFCAKAHLPILGVVENMSGYICPHCRQEAPLFGRGGGEAMAENMGIPFLGSLPFDPSVVFASNEGKPLPESQGEPCPFSDAMREVVGRITQLCGGVV